MPCSMNGIIRLRRALGKPVLLAVAELCYFCALQNQGKMGLPLNVGLAWQIPGSATM